MKTAFQTDRLDVFKIEPEREDGYSGTDVYLGFHRCGQDVWPYHPVVIAPPKMVASNGSTTRICPGKGSRSNCSTASWPMSD